MSLCYIPDEPVRRL